MIEMNEAGDLEEMLAEFMVNLKLKQKAPRIHRKSSLVIAQL